MNKDDKKKIADKSLITDDSDIIDALDKLIERSREENEALRELLRLMNYDDDEIDPK